MNNPKRPKNTHAHYHAHIYFEEQTLLFAINLSEKIAQQFPLIVGRIHQKLVGPHTKWSFQVLFDHLAFDEFIAWLALNRGDLSVLVHAQTGDDLLDHTEHACWLGDSVAIDTSRF
ncbi:DOPA 4,5-dioxygenase [Psychromonas marina]|uniref:DOPA 4,5-dioxygenase n=1 Tax=Psychromonas marina TaxID=88364 RepID=A0ABQ6E4D5_9GAMM|nr:DOPA 4,5-dioxygenase family protein [Psychromonas marina]GLS92060.1 DOPA 4,5-dioxygenase [Psychromonas marina]